MPPSSQGAPEDGESDAETKPEGAESPDPNPPAQASDRRQFGRVRVLIHDENPKIAGHLRAGLLALGVNSAEVAADGVAARETAAKRRHDVFLFDISAEPEGWLKHLTSLRMGLVEGDPFALHLLTGPKPTEALASLVVNCGCDAYLARPFTQGALDQTLRNFLTLKRAFVIAPNYVGPDRRSADRAHTGAPLIPAPNPVREKAAASFDPEALALRAWRVSLAYRARLIERTIDAIAKHLRESSESDRERFLAPVQLGMRQIHRMAQALLDEPLRIGVQTAAAPPTRALVQGVKPFMVGHASPSGASLGEMKRLCAELSGLYFKALP
ncbi:MAG: hypothetical protein QNJ84_00125 [Alphaproteobacteria bacterium]|nr:hypothetical protein [Alphaproteobacteria bacterium]